jgi:hypothetical protein
MNNETLSLIKEVCFWFFVPASLLFGVIYILKKACRAIARDVIAEEKVLFEETELKSDEKDPILKKSADVKLRGAFIPNPKWSKYSRS